MVDYTKPQQWKKEEGERLRGEGNKIKFIDLRFERGQVVGLVNISKWAPGVKVTTTVRK